jgi:hypothetical protein
MNQQEILEVLFAAVILCLGFLALYNYCKEREPEFDSRFQLEKDQTQEFIRQLVDSMNIPETVHSVVIRDLRTRRCFHGGAVSTFKLVRGSFPIYHSISFRIYFAPYAETFYSYRSLLRGNHTYHKSEFEKMFKPVSAIIRHWGTLFADQPGQPTYHPPARQLPYIRI